jgi:nucleotide-binding universal stress UspA family protein
VLFAELIGPACTKYALEKSCEAAVPSERAAGPEGLKARDFLLEESRDVQLVPWSWEKLIPAPASRGSVVFGVSHQSTVNGLARMATLLAHHFKAQPVAVRIDTVKDVGPLQIDPKELFAYAAQEVRSLGYTLHTSEVRAESVAKGIIAAAKEKEALTVLLGYPFQRTEHSFNKIIEEVSSTVSCSIIIVRFTGILHTERILVPIVHAADLESVGDTLCALAHVGKHSITLLRLLSADVQDTAVTDNEKKLYNWAAAKNLPFAKCVVTRTEARLETIIKEAQTHDLLIMAASEGFGIKKMLLGSLADDVADNCQRPMLLVYCPRV